jgi:hypothetical protein
MTMDAQAVALLSGEMVWSGITTSLVVVIALMKVAPRNGGKSRSVHREPNDCIEPLAANQPIYTAGRYRESAPMLG